MNDKRRATIYNNYNNIIIMTALARLIITNHQIVIALSNFESFNIRLFSVIIMMLSKIEFKTQHKRVLNFKSDHLFFSSDLDSNSIINFFIRDNRKRLKCINTPLNQSTFKFKSVILLTIFISSLFILSNQSIFKSRSFTFFILIDITQKQIKVVFFKIRSNKRIFKRDFSRYNKALNKTFRQFKRIFEFLNKDYVSIYLFNNIIILGNFTLESSSKSINNNDFFNIIV